MNAKVTADEDTDEANTQTLVSGALLQQKMMEQGGREARLADEPLGPERPTGVDFLAFYEATGLSVGDRFVWDDGVVSEVVEIFEARQDGLFGSEGDDIIHFTAPEHEEPMPEGAEGIGRDLARGTITLADD